MKPRPSLALRIVVFGLALVGILGVVGGGVYLVVRQFASRPALKLGSITIPQGSGIEQTLTGMYLQLRQGELDTPASEDTTTVSFDVREGETAGDIATRLATMGLIRDASLFRMLVKYYGLADKLEAGQYDLSPSMTMMEIAETMQHGRLRDVRVTIPEGWRLEEVAELLGEKNVVDEAEFLKLVRNGDLSQAPLSESGAIAGSSLEGYLFPDTYDISPTAATLDVVELMLSGFEQRFTAEMKEQARALGLTIHEVVTMASIVEREAVVPKERALIAGVYYNRLGEDMPLGADPTVQYAKGYDSELSRWWGALTVDDLQGVDSPYNTYIYRGLPPGPICNPGLASIQAALSPTASDYFYFLRNDIEGDGSHVFARTFDEHLANLARYRR